MKTLSLILLTVFAGSMASASSFGLLLSKNISAGFSPVQYRVTSRCNVYADRIEITKSAGNISTSQVVKIAMTGDIQSLIAEAAAGKITSEVAPTDGPITSYVAYNSLASEVTLKSLGSSRQNNDALSAITLVNLIDQLCK